MSNRSHCHELQRARFTRPFHAPVSSGVKWLLMRLLFANDPVEQLQAPARSRGGGRRPLSPATGRDLPVLLSLMILPGHASSVSRW
jgi:hypothetical protein